MPCRASARFVNHLIVLAPLKDDDDYDDEERMRANKREHARPTRASSVWTFSIFILNFLRITHDHFVIRAFAPDGWKFTYPKQSRINFAILTSKLNPDSFRAIAREQSSSLRRMRGMNYRETQPLASCVLARSTETFAQLQTSVHSESQMDLGCFCLDKRNSSTESGFAGKRSD